MEGAHGEMGVVADLAETRNDLRMTLRLADLDLFIIYDTLSIYFSLSFLEFQFAYM